MQFRRSGQRDERRRRVLMEEVLNSPAGAAEQEAAGRRDAGQSGAGNSSRRYSESALASRQPPVTALIPQRPWTLSVLFLLGLVGIAATLTLYARVFYPARGELQAALAGLDVTRYGSLASWYAALLLALAACTSVMVFALRRHRLDDYRGRYRVWIPATLALLLASLIAATGLHGVAARAFLERSAGAELAAWCSLAVLWVGFGLGGLRLLLEMRGSRLAVVFLAAAALLYALATSFALHLWLGEIPLVAALAGCAAQLLAHLCVTFTALAYCRFVYLDAQGAVPPRPQKAKRERSSDRAGGKVAGEPAETRRRGQRSIRVDAAHETLPASRPAAKPQITAAQAHAAQDGSAEQAEEDRKLSKAERRRLRKQQRRQNRST